MTQLFFCHVDFFLGTFHFRKIYKKKNSASSFSSYFSENTLRNEITNQGLGIEDPMIKNISLTFLVLRNKPMWLLISLLFEKKYLRQRKKWENYLTNKSLLQDGYLYLGSELKSCPLTSSQLWDSTGVCDTFWQFQVNN